MIQHNLVNMSISQMVSNPTGKYSAFFASRARVKSQLDSIFINNLRRYRKQFYAVPYIDSNTKNIIFYVSVPSEAYSINKIRWDCIVEIEYDSTKSLDNRFAKFFSNSPSFIYTYAYVFNQEGLLPNFIKPKMPPQCLNQPPVIKNPVETRGFDKILYQALKYLLIGGCLTDDYITKYKQPWNTITKAQVTVRVADTDRLVTIYQNAKHMESVRRGTNRKTITTAEKNKIDKAAQSYEKFKKQSTPKYVGWVIRRSPRSKITARKAKKYLNTKVAKKAKRTSTTY